MQKETFRENLPIILLTRDAHLEGKWLLDLQRALIAQGAVVQLLPLSSFHKIGQWRMLINRCSDAAPPSDVKRCMAALRAAELRGLPTINGLSCYAIGTSKVLHHELFDSVGVESPPWVQITRGNTLSEIVQAAESVGIRYPLLIKPNSGGFGAGIAKVTHAKGFTVDTVETAFGTDGVAMLQQFETPEDGCMYRVFFLNGTIQCGVRVPVQTQSYNACVCSTEFERWEVPVDVAKDVQAMACKANADCGSVELMYVASKPLYFDFNLLSTMPDEDCYAQLATYILSNTEDSLDETKLQEIQENNFNGFVTLFSTHEVLLCLGKSSGNAKMHNNGQLYVDGICSTECADFQALQSTFGQPGSKLWVLLDKTNNTVIGSVGIKITRNNTAKIAELARMYVDRRHQKKGYGRRLVEHLVQYVKTLQDCAGIQLSTPSVNASALGFYQRMGLHVTKTFVITGPDGEPLELTELKMSWVSMQATASTIGVLEEHRN